MNLLRAQARQKDGWMEMRLLDLDIVADGPSEDAVLRDLEHTLIGEYLLAIHMDQTPFVKLFRGCPPDVSKSWHDGDKKMKQLNLPMEVRMALAAVFMNPNFSEVAVEAA